MTCNEIENRLPAYLEDLLSPEEQRSIEEHIASCPGCSRALLDLKRAEQLVQDLEDVEPPPFFEQRIMSRVREEAARKQGILRRLFYPLHIKVPIQALTTILIAIFAFYVYQAGDPEMKQMAPLPAPLAQPDKDQVASESPKAIAPPSVATPSRRAPAGDFSEKDRQRFAGPPLENNVKRKEGMIDASSTAGEGQKTSSPSPAKMMAEASLHPAEQGGVSMRVLWRINEYRLGGSALWGEEEAHTLLFKPLDITASTITFDGKTCGNVVFNKDKVNTKEYLDRTFHSTPQALGIEGETVELVKTNCLLPGFSEYMRLKDRRIVIHINGVFFFFAPEVNY